MKITGYRIGFGFEKDFLKYFVYLESFPHFFKTEMKTKKINTIQKIGLIPILFQINFRGISNDVIVSTVKYKLLNQI